jgi:transcriptional regulator with XRE-family HTH domain
MDGLSLRRAREQHGYTREQIAEQVGRNAATVERWEAGAHTPPRTVRVRLAQILDAPELIDD